MGFKYSFSDGDWRRLGSRMQEKFIKIKIEEELAGGVASLQSAGGVHEVFLQPRNLGPVQGALFMEELLHGRVILPLFCKGDQPVVRVRVHMTDLI